jgi:hypothetical protein
MFASALVKKIRFLSQTKLDRFHGQTVVGDCKGS